MSRRVVLFSVVLALFATATQSQESHKHQRPSLETLGKVHFPVVCNELAQDNFDRGMALLHSFWYDEAAKSFGAITNMDQQCAMAYWGLAMSYFRPLWEPPSADDIRKASDAIEKAKSIGGKTEREKDYIAAIEVFFKDTDKLDHRTRLLAYEKAMEQLHLKYSDDREAAVFYALALIATSPKTDKTFANNRKAGEILKNIFVDQPNHPGVAHYIIHTYDSPQLASLGLDAAQKYASIAPSVPHALHMPSHIFIRLGMWEENVKTNIASANAGQEGVQKNDPGATSFDALHAWDYIVYGYLQTAQDKKIPPIVEGIAKTQRTDRPNLAAAYGLAAIPARYALERHQWEEAASLTPQPAAFPWDRYPWVEALVYFARAIGSARSGDAVGAKKNAERIKELHAASLAKNDQYWAGQVEILQKAAEAWTAHAEGRSEDAVKSMRAAADLEDATDKHPVTPGSLIPARELLGELLLELNRPSEALAEFEASLKLAVNRYNGIYGVARAAELAGDKAKAKMYYEKLLALCEKADSERPELKQAKMYLAVKGK
jgi:hypothetical protein